MVLELEAASLREAMLQDPAGAIQMEVHVQARRQYIAGAFSSRRSRLTVVKQAIGLILHTRQDGDRPSLHLLNAFSRRTEQRNFTEQRASHNLENDLASQEQLTFQSIEDVLGENCSWGAQSTDSGQ